MDPPLRYPQLETVELLNLLCTSSPLEFHTLTLASAQQMESLSSVPADVWLAQYRPSRYEHVHACVPPLR